VSERVDIAVVGAGAAGLMAAIQAGRAARRPGTSGNRLSIVALDGARSLGAKILVAGGGRCNVTHHEVSEKDYAGSSRNAIRKVLLRYGVDSTVQFFREMGVDLKLEETGKLFPTTDSARTVLDALLRAAREVNVDVRHPRRVGSVRVLEDGWFAIDEDPDAEHGKGWGTDGGLLARRVILASGGRSLPKSGSDGKGHDIVRALGHTITRRVFPALVPLTMPKDHPLCALSGLSVVATVFVRTSTGKRVAEFTDSLLLTHFGLSGPAGMNISRFFTDALRDDQRASLCVNFLPDQTEQSIDAALVSLGKQHVAGFLRDRHLPERLARTICDIAQVDPSTTGANLSKDARRALARTLTSLELPVTGDRGWNYAEVTAGGVPLSEIRLETMESRLVSGLHLCGEICDVDGRIGGFNFQWAWASGFVAGSSAASSLHPLPRGLGEGGGAAAG
jgi:predicted Rossmann fold flavoprotein